MSTTFKASEIDALIIIIVIYEKVRYVKNIIKTMAKLNKPLAATIILDNVNTSISCFDLLAATAYPNNMKLLEIIKNQ